MEKQAFTHLSNDEAQSVVNNISGIGLHAIKTMSAMFKDGSTSLEDIIEHCIVTQSAAVSTHLLLVQMGEESREALDRSMVSLVQLETIKAALHDSLRESCVTAESPVV